MDALLLPIAASLSAVALGVSVVSLAIHWVRRKEHPDVTGVRSELLSLRADLMELWDKFDHQVKRDRVRRLRASKEGQPDGDEEQHAPVANVADLKRQLRSQLRGRV